MWGPGGWGSYVRSPSVQASPYAFRDWADQEANVRVLQSALGDEEVVGREVQEGEPPPEEVWGSEEWRSRPNPPRKQSSLYAYREWTDQEANVRVLHSDLGDEEVTGSDLQKGVPLLEEVWTQGSRTRPLPVCTHLRLREQEGAWK